MFLHDRNTFYILPPEHQNAGDQRPGDLPVAEAVGAEAVRRLPRYSDAWLNYGIACSMTGNPQEAKRAFDNALKHDPRLAEAHVGLADYYLSQKNPPRAIHHLFLAVQNSVTASRLNNLAVNLF